MITLEEHLKGSEVILGPRNVSPDTTKLSDKTVHETLNTINKAIVQFLNLANRNIVEFKDILAQKIREQDAQIISVSDNVHQIKKKNDALYDKVRRLEYKYRNLTYQQKGQEQQEPTPLKKTGISALLLAAIAGLFLLYQHADKIRARINAWLGHKEEEQTRPEVESEKKPPIIKSLEEDFKIHASSINIDGEIINMEVFYEFCFDARKLVFKADEITIDSPQIILQSNPIVDPTYGKWEAGAATTQQFQPDAQHPPVVSSTPQFPMHSPTQTWDEGVQAVPSGPGPNPTPTAPSDPGQTFGLPPITSENAFPDTAKPDAKSDAKPIDTPVRPPMQGATDADTETPPPPAPISKTNVEPVAKQQATSLSQPMGTIGRIEGGIPSMQSLSSTGTPTTEIKNEPKIQLAGPPPQSEKKSQGEFKVQLGGMAAWASDNTGVFKPGMMANYAQKAAQGMVDKMPKEKYDKLPQDVKDHVQAALEGRGNFDLNFVIRRTAPLMTRAELEQTKKEMAEGSITLIEPEGWKTPDEQQTTTPAEQQPPTQPESPPPSQPEQPQPYTPQTSQDTPQPSPTPQAPQATPQETPSRGPEPITPSPSESPKSPSTEAPKPVPPSPQQSPVEIAPQETEPVTDDPEREPAQSSSGSYGGMRGGVDHNANICMI